MLDRQIVLSYVLPIRAALPPPAELIDYLRSLPPFIEVIVVDGSDRAVFRDLHARCPPRVRHVAPDPDLRHYRNGKVAGAITGVRLASFGKEIGRASCRERV